MESYRLPFTDMVTASLMQRFSDSIAVACTAPHAVEGQIKMFVFKSRNGTAEGASQESRLRLGRDSDI